MSEELKPCPCCGSERIGGATNTVTCWDCGLTISRPRPLANAVAAWNARPAPAVQVPDEDAAFSAWADGKWPLAKKSHALGAWSREHMRSARDGWMARAALAPVTVATEAVAQGGGVDAEKVMALVQEFGRRCAEYGCYGPDLENIRALLASPAVPVGDGWIAVGDRLPEAGKGVLAYYKNSAGYGRIVRAFYAPKHTLEANSYDDDGQFDYDEAADTAYLPEGWLEKIDNWDDFSSIYIVEGEVTHWQPLPPAPAATKKEA